MELLESSQDSLDIVYDIDTKFPLITAMIYNETFSREQEFLNAYTPSVPNPKTPPLVLDIVSCIFIKHLQALEDKLRQIYDSENQNY